MKVIFTLKDINEENKQEVGGKALALAKLYQNGFNVPTTYCLSGNLYRDFIEQTGLNQKILFLLNRKNLEDLRWEEIWDLSLAIRNLFLRTELPSDLYSILMEKVDRLFENSPVAVRSSSAFEDSPKYSFAGLHESFINIRSTEEVIKHIKLVWASLWSNTAIMYRKELNLDIEKAQMAVILQEMVFGDVSGILFGLDPQSKTQIIIEAVYGLNQALVDGSIDPDRWTIDKETRNVIRHQFVERKSYLTPSPKGVGYRKLPLNLATTSPLDKEKLTKLVSLADDLESFFGYPQDCEWTFKKNELILLQSRPITTIKKDERGFNSEDQRNWYLSLTRSYEDLKRISAKIKNEYFPEMEKVANSLSNEFLQKLDDEELAKEIEIRHALYFKWKDTYWEEFIPLAHGIRLFGKIYNDMVEPENPYEYVQLLSGTSLISTQRNEELLKIVRLIRDDENLRKNLKHRNLEDPKVKNVIDDLKEKVLNLTSLLDKDSDLRDVIDFILGYDPRQTSNLKMETEIKNTLESKFFSSFDNDEQERARELLNFGRESYKLRDDDNIYLGKIEKKLRVSLEEATFRLNKRGILDPNELSSGEIIKSLRDKNYIPKRPRKDLQKSKYFELKARQIVGTATSPGLARGKAKVVQTKKDLLSFKRGEILICDSIDPNMTFIVPLAAGIVERRGGILVHGAIIAREYGIPCVTGVPNAANLIDDRDDVTVDGYIGLVIIKKDI